VPALEADLRGLVGHMAARPEGSSPVKPLL